MPGIVGLVDTFDIKTFEKMICSLKHSNSYKTDTYCEEKCGIARIHLGTFNPQSQPSTDDKKKVIVFLDGIIYNDDAKNYSNDADFCLSNYLKYKEKFLSSLNGYFTLVIYDKIENKILLCSDRYGNRPIYYTNDMGNFKFSSEIKAFLKDDTFAKSLDADSVFQFFSYGEILGDNTFFKNVLTIPPASILTYDIDAKSTSIKKYWELQYENKLDVNEDKIVNDLVNSFKKAVNIRLTHSDKNGIFLSGGLDSRSILAAFDCKKKVIPFSFGKKKCNDLKIVQKITKMYSLDTRYINLNCDLILKHSKEAIFLTDGMDILTVGYLPYVANVAKSDVKVIFQGLAGDLLLGGSFLKKEIFESNSDKELAESIYKTLNIFSRKELKELFNENFMTLDKDYLEPILNQLAMIEEDHPANKSDIFFLLNHVRKFTIMGGVITRAYLEEAIPTYDNNFIETILKIPPELRFNHQIYKKFLQALSPELAKIAYSKTMVSANASVFRYQVGSLKLKSKGKILKVISKIMGLSLESNANYVDFNYWLRACPECLESFKQIIMGKDSKLLKFTNLAFIEKLFDEQDKNIKNNATKIIYLASFELFLELFFEDEFT